MSLPSAPVDRLLNATLAGHGGTVVVRAATTPAPAEGRFRMIRVVATEADRELPKTALHQLCAQLLDQVDQLSHSDRSVLGAAFAPGPTPGSTDAPSPSLTGLAILRLLQLAARRQPLVCRIDNAHWLDRASADTFAFLARRLADESVALIFTAVRPDDADALAGLSEAPSDDQLASSEPLRFPIIPAPRHARTRHPVAA